MHDSGTMRNGLGPSGPQLPLLAADIAAQKVNPAITAMLKTVNAASKNSVALLVGFPIQQALVRNPSDTNFASDICIIANTDEEVSFETQRRCETDSFLYHCAPAVL